MNESCFFKVNIFDIITSSKNLENMWILIEDGISLMELTVQVSHCVRRWLLRTTGVRELSAAIWG